jgi:hypothetical protein
MLDNSGLVLSSVVVESIDIRFAERGPRGELDGGSMTTDEFGFSCGGLKSSGGSSSEMSVLNLYISHVAPNAKRIKCEEEERRKGQERKEGGEKEGRKEGRKEEREEGNGTKGGREWNERKKRKERRKKGRKEGRKKNIQI